MAGESRTELLQFTNDLLGTNYNKIEQCGTGAAYCQIIDSIFGDVPMNRVKFEAKQEYEYLANYRILQNSFKIHSIDKPIPVDRLVRCKMQDNLEFMQWLKRFWDMNFPGGDYDPVARRGGAGARAPSASGAGAARAPVASTSAAPAARRPPPAARPNPAPAARAPLGTGRVSSARSSSAAGSRGGVDPAALEALTAQMSEMKLSVEGLEKERDFYFNKLREIEIIIAARLEVAEAPANEDAAPVTEDEKETLLKMQQILYSTEEGFEIPQELEDGDATAPYEEENEEETF
ncbi:microtubule integrity protein mal3 [Rhodotorula sphaerocarpa]